MYKMPIVAGLKPEVVGAERQGRPAPGQDDKQANPASGAPGWLAY